MADIDKITVGNTTYNVKDSTARESINQTLLEGKLVLSKVNRTVQLNLLGYTMTGSSSNTTICTLPVEFRPVNYAYLNGRGGEIGIIYQSGAVIINANISGNLWCSITYLAAQ